MLKYLLLFILISFISSNSYRINNLNQKVNISKINFKIKNIIYFQDKEENPSEKNNILKHQVNFIRQELTNQTLTYLIINFIFSFIMIIIIIFKIFNQCSSSCLKSSEPDKSRDSNNKDKLLINGESENIDNLNYNKKLKLITSCNIYGTKPLYWSKNWTHKRKFIIFPFGFIVIFIIYLIVCGVKPIQLKYFVIINLVQIYLLLILDQLLICGIYKHYTKELINSINEYIFYLPIIKKISGTKNYKECFDISGRLNLELNEVNKLEYKYELYIDNSIEEVTSHLNTYFDLRENYFIFNFWGLLKSYFFLFTLTGYFYNLYKESHCKNIQFTFKKVVIFDENNFDSSEVDNLKSNGLIIKFGKKIINFRMVLAV